MNKRAKTSLVQRLHLVSSVLIATYENWMYLYIERPIATYTTWYRGALDSKQLTQYYKENPEEIPKYIYIESANPQGTMAQFGINHTTSTQIESIVMSELFVSTYFMGIVFAYAGWYNRFYKLTFVRCT